MEHAAIDWAKVVLSVTLPIGLSLAAMASAAGLGKAVAAAMEAMARQPEASGKIQGAMLVGCAFIEALTIYTFITVILFGIGFLKV